MSRKYRLFLSLIVVLMVAFVILVMANDHVSAATSSAKITKVEKDKWYDKIFSWFEGKGKKNKNSKGSSSDEGIDEEIVDEGIIDEDEDDEEEYIIPLDPVLECPPDDKFVCTDVELTASWESNCDPAPEFWTTITSVPDDPDITDPLVFDPDAYLTVEPDPLVTPGSAGLLHWGLVDYNMFEEDTTYTLTFHMRQTCIGWPYKCILYMVVGYYSTDPDPSDPSANLLATYYKYGPEVEGKETCFVSDVPGYIGDEGCFHTSCSKCIQVGDIDGHFMILEVSPDINEDGIPDPLETLCAADEDEDESIDDEGGYSDETSSDVGSSDEGKDEGIDDEGDEDEDEEIPLDIRETECSVNFVVEKSRLLIDESSEYYFAGELLADNGYAYSGGSDGGSNGCEDDPYSPHAFRPDCQLSSTDIEGGCRYPTGPVVPYKEIISEATDEPCKYEVKVVCEDCGNDVLLSRKIKVYGPAYPADPTDYWYEDDPLYLFCGEDCNDNCVLDCWDGPFDFECFKIDEYRMDTIPPKPAGSPGVEYPDWENTAEWNDNIYIRRGSFVMWDTCSSSTPCKNPDEGADYDIHPLAKFSTETMVQVIINGSYQAAVYWKDFEYEVPNIDPSDPDPDIHNEGEEFADASAQGSFVYKWSPGDPNPPLMPDPDFYTIPSDYYLEIRLNFYKAPDSPDPVGNSNAGGALGEDPNSPAYWLAGRDAGAFSVTIENTYGDEVFYNWAMSDWESADSTQGYQLEIELQIDNQHGVAGKYWDSWYSPTPGAQAEMWMNKYPKVFAGSLYPNRYFYKMGLFEDGHKTLWGDDPGAGVNANCIIPQVCLTELEAGLSEDYIFPAYYELKKRPGYLPDYSTVNPPDARHQIGPWLTYVAVPNCDNYPSSTCNPCDDTVDPDCNQISVYVWDTSCLYCVNPDDSIKSKPSRGLAKDMGGSFGRLKPGSVKDDDTVNGVRMEELGDRSLCGQDNYIYCDPNFLCYQPASGSTPAYYYCGIGTLYPDCQHESPRKDSPFCLLTMGLLNAVGDVVGTDSKSDYDDHPKVGNIDPDTTTFTVGTSSIDMDTSGKTCIKVGDHFTSPVDGSEWEVIEVEENGENLPACY